MTNEQERVVVYCKITYHGKKFEGRGFCKEAACQCALDKFHSFFGVPTWKEADNVIIEYM